MTRIIYIDESEFHTRVLRALLGSRPRLRVVASVQHQREFFKTLETTTADIAMLGVWDDNQNKCQTVARKIRKKYPELKIVAFARDNTHSIVTKMLEAGINAVISSAKFDHETIEDLLEKIANNEKYIAPIKLYKNNKLKGEFLPEIPEKWITENLTIVNPNTPTITSLKNGISRYARTKRKRSHRKVNDGEAKGLEKRVISSEAKRSEKTRPKRPRIQKPQTQYKKCK